MANANDLGVILGTHLKSEPVLSLLPIMLLMYHLDRKIQPPFLVLGVKNVGILIPKLVTEHQRGCINQKLGSKYLCLYFGHGILLPTSSLVYIQIFLGKSPEIVLAKVEFWHWKLNGANSL